MTTKTTMSRWRLRKKVNRHHGPAGERHSGVFKGFTMPIQEWSEHIWLVKLSNDPEFNEELAAVRVRLEKCLARSGGRPSGLPDIVLDLSDVEHVNSSNLSQLLRLRKMMIDGEVRLRLISPTDAVWIVFISTALDKVFEFREDAATALAELQIGD